MNNVTVDVTNTGKRNIVRLGILFPAGQTVKGVQVPKRHLIALKAVRDLEVKVIDPGAGEDNQKSKIPRLEDGGVTSFKKMAVDQVLELVESGQIDPEKALEIEKAEQGRKTLIEQLEIILEEQEEGQEGDE